MNSVISAATIEARNWMVNVESSSYRVAREYMIRLDHQDLEDPDRLGVIAAASGLSASAFRDRYGYLTEG
jgi:6-phosphofructokinase 1